MIAGANGETADGIAEVYTVVTVVLKNINCI